MRDISKRAIDPELNGILLVDKPKGMTSHDVVDAIRRRFDLNKVGHAGTLDPMATGLLIILIGKATKLSALFLNDDKAYAASLVFGVTSDTQDITGTMVRGSELNISREAFEKLLEGFLGEQDQMAPMYSAKKHKGMKLYQFARKGIEIDRKPHRINIKSITLKKFSRNDAEIDVTCSKGTYIRQLVSDIGIRSGCGACLSALVRTSSGKHDLHKAADFAELMKMDFEGLRKLCLK